MTVVLSYGWGEQGLNELSREGRIELAARAQAIAVIAHRGQKDKLGVEYIRHPAAVAVHFDPIERTLECCAAWLHDVLEDTDITAADLLLAGMYPEVIEIVEFLTRREGDGDEYYARIARSPEARCVKIFDIMHNTDPARVQKLDESTRSRLREKYAHALELLDAPPVDQLWEWVAGLSEFGNPVLYRAGSGHGG